jgi:hypothetical protein
VATHSESRDKVIMKIRPEKGIYVMYAGKIPEGYQGQERRIFLAQKF